MDFTPTPKAYVLYYTQNEEELFVVCHFEFCNGVNWKKFDEVQLLQRVCDLWSQPQTVGLETRPSGPAGGMVPEVTRYPRLGQDIIIHMVTKKIQVPKMEVLWPIRLFCWWGFPYKNPT